MRRLAGLLSAVILATLAPLSPVAPIVPGCAAAGSGHAALVVEHGDGSVLTRCVSFGTATVTGDQLLDSSGVAWSGQAFGSYGQAVCALDSEPAHYTSCPGQDGYWAVFVSRDGGAWQLSSIGISSLTLADGDAEGFRYVPAAGNPAPPPSPAGLCAEVGAASAGAASPTSSASPRTPAPPSGPGLDPGLAAAALAGGGLAGLALLRLAAGRRRGK
jgi:hypothetical protein